MSWIRRLREALVQDDPHPELSRLDRMDGLGNEPEDRGDGAVAARAPEA